MKYLIKKSALQHKGGNLNLAEFHPILIHYPIVFFTFALLLDFISLFLKIKGRLRWLAEVAIAAGTFCCIPVLISGWIALSQVPQHAHGLQGLASNHVVGGYMATVAGLCYAFLRILGIREKWNIPKYVYVLIGTIFLGILLETGKSGGELVRKKRDNIVFIKQGKSTQK